MNDSVALYLVRHCEATGQEPAAPLTSVGLEQSESLAEFLLARNPVRLVSSPYVRAKQSIQPLALRLGLAVEKDDRLVERRLGIVPDGDWKRALRESFDHKERRLPEGESTAAALTRGRAVIDEILSKSTLPAVIVTHGNLLSLIAHSFNEELGYDFWHGLTNPDVFSIHDSSGNYRVIRIWK